MRWSRRSVRDSTSTPPRPPACSACRSTQVDGVLRNRVKAMNYGLAYGLSAYGLSQQLGISADEARTLMAEYFERFGGVRDYLNKVVERARHDGYTETIMGRRRYLPDLNSDNRQRREMAERMALNAPIQGSAADIIKVAMLNVDRALRGSGRSVADAAPGARRTRLRDCTGRTGGRRGAGAARDGRRVSRSGRLSTSRWASARRGTPLATERSPDLVFFARFASHSIAQTSRRQVLTRQLLTRQLLTRHLLTQTFNSGRPT